MYESEKKLREFFEQQQQRTQKDLSRAQQDLARAQQDLARTQLELSQAQQELAKAKSVSNQAVPTMANMPSRFNWHSNHNFADGNYPAQGTIYGFGGYPTHPMSMQGPIPPATPAYPMATSKPEAFHRAQKIVGGAEFLDSLSHLPNDMRKVEVLRADALKLAGDLSQANHCKP